MNDSQQEHEFADAEMLYDHAFLSTVLILPAAKEAGIDCQTAGMNLTSGDRIAIASATVAIR